MSRRRKNKKVSSPQQNFGSRQGAVQTRSFDSDNSSTLHSSNDSSVQLKPAKDYDLTRGVSPLTNSLFVTSESLSNETAVSGTPVIQRAHKKGKNRVQEARQRKNANRRNNQKKEQARQQEAAESWSETVSSWANWAWDSAKEIGITALTKAYGGVNPVEVAQTLVAVYNSNMSITTKIKYLALYGGYQASVYLKENMATIIGGDVGAMMELEQDINGQLEQSAQLWESGEIDEGQVKEVIADKILDAVG